MVFWLDQKLKDIYEELDQLELNDKAILYGPLLQLACKGNQLDNLVKIWDKYLSIFSDEAPNAQTISQAIKAASERFEDSSIAVKILNESQERFGYSATNSLLTALCFRSLNTLDTKSAIELLPLITPSIHLYKSALRCAAQTGNLELYNLSWPHIEEKSSDLAEKLFSWTLQVLAKSSPPNSVLDHICNSPDKYRIFLSIYHYEQLAKHLFDTVDQINNAYFYLEQKESSCIQVIDLIIVGCGLLKETTLALETFNAIESLNLKPQRSTYNAVMKTLYENKEYTKVSNVFGELEENGFEANSESYEFLISSLLKIGDNPKLILEKIADATDKYISLKYSVYDLAVKYCIQNSNPEAAQYIIRQMKRLGLDISVIQNQLHNVSLRLTW